MTVLNLPEVLAGLAGAGAAITAEIPDALDQSAAVVVEAWAQNISGEGLVLSGNYRDSVHAERDELGVRVLTDVSYAGILEYGNSRQAGHHVAERAFDERHDAMLDAAADRLAPVIR